jgi:hypothetical protein
MRLRIVTQDYTVIPDFIPEIFKGSIKPLPELYLVGTYRVIYTSRHF